MLFLLFTVLDEADRILDLGFQEAMNAIIENLPSERQTLLYSATQTKYVLKFKSNFIIKITREARICKCKHCVLNEGIYRERFPFSCEALKHVGPVLKWVILSKLSVKSYWLGHFRHWTLGHHTGASFYSLYFYSGRRRWISSLYLSFKVLDLSGNNSWVLLHNSKCLFPLEISRYAFKTFIWITKLAWRPFWKKCITNGLLTVTLHWI